MNRFSLNDKTALITGASRGLGKAIALAFADAGANVVLVSRSESTLLKVKKEIEQKEGRANIFPFDLFQVDEVGELFHRIRAETGHVDILVNVAGTIFRTDAVDFPLDQWQRILTLNLTVPFVLSQSFARACIDGKHPGKIINIASLLSEAARPGIPAYTASKGGIKQLTMALAVEWAKYKINVNAIGPGYFETELTKPLVDDKAFTRWVKESTPIGRWGLPDELTGAAVFLASAASDFITGQTIYVDGGWLANL
ncbi:MAG: SDR family oxidoreductase [Calditrichaeota bacterium]|nr:SDR family oxidoreductase [Calditrichota bacterium]